MKKILILAIALVLIGASVSFALISGSKHDLSSSGPNATEFNINDICVFCHTPHGGLYGSAAPAPLWNRNGNVTAWTNGAAYTSNSLNGASSTPAGANDISKACLSCHDGDIGDEVLLNGPGSGNLNMDVSANDTGPFGTIGNLNDAAGLQNDHPIGIAIDAGDNFIQSAANITGAGLLLYGTGGNLVECSSCHVVHNSTAFQPLLRITNAASAMCVACHIK